MHPMWKDREIPVTLQTLGKTGEEIPSQTSI